MINNKLATLLSVSILAAPAVSAVEVYKDDKNAVSIGGYIDVRAINTQNQTEIVNGASRINFAFKRQLKNDWEALALIEWGVNPVGNSDIVYNNRFESIQDEFLYNRLGYAGLSNDKYGQITIVNNGVRGSMLFTPPTTAMCGMVTQQVFTHIIKTMAQ